MKQALNKSFYPVIFLSFSFFFLFIILPLVTQQMRGDGVIYAGIAKNLSLGFGSIWKPYFTQTVYPEFYEHPSLALYIQSLFFNALGQSFLIERLYCFVIILIQLSVLYYWIKRNVVNSQFSVLLLLWVLIPLNHRLCDNFLEGTLSVFTTFATLLLCIQFKSRPALLLQYVASAIAIAIAFFCNGLQAFFPLAVPIVKKLVDSPRTLTKAIKETSILTGLVAVFITSVFLLFPDSLNNMKQYFNQQLLPATLGQRDLSYTGIKHLYILLLYFKAYILVSAFAFLCIYTAAKIANQNPLRLFKAMINHKNVKLFLILSLVAALPVGISHRQRSNYIIQSAPFFTLAMMYLCHEALNTIVNYCKNHSRLYQSILSGTTILFILSLFIVAIYPFKHQENALMADIKYLINYLPQNEVINASPQIYNNWIAAIYLNRYSMVSIDNPDKKSLHTYYISFKNESIPSNYQLLNIPLSKYNLAKLIS